MKKIILSLTFCSLLFSLYAQTCRTAPLKQALTELSNYSYINIKFENIPDTLVILESTLPYNLKPEVRKQTLENLKKVFGIKDTVIYYKEDVYELIPLKRHLLKPTSDTVKTGILSRGVGDDLTYIRFSVNLLAGNLGLYYNIRMYSKDTKVNYDWRLKLLPFKELKRLVYEKYGIKIHKEKKEIPYLVYRIQ